MAASSDRWPELFGKPFGTKTEMMEALADPLYASNEEFNKLVVSRIAASDGQLAPAGRVVSVPLEVRMTTGTHVSEADARALHQAELEAAYAELKANYGPMALPGADTVRLTQRVNGVLVDDEQRNANAQAAQEVARTLEAIERAQYEQAAAKERELSNLRGQALGWDL